MSHTPKMTSESAREVLKFDAEVWGAGLYGGDTTKLYKDVDFYNLTSSNITELCKDILSVYQALKKASHFHPVIEILRRDAEVITKRLYGTIPKQEWQPQSAIEQIAYDYLLQKNHEAPKEKDVRKHIYKIKGGLPK